MLWLEALVTKVNVKSRALLRAFQRVLTSQELVSIFMLELHVETYRIAQETDVGFLTQTSKVSEYMNTGMWHLSQSLGWS